jgi:DnaK suppressor protein
MLKKRMKEEQAHLEQQVRELEAPPDFGDVPGPEDDTDEDVAALNQEATAHALREKLANIESALLKMEKGTYGVCEVCGGEIDEHVLVMVPDARRCQSCNQKMHTRQK